MPQQYFIIGTDTDCGKTYVTCALIRHFKRLGEDACGLKPVASGGDADVVALQQANGSLSPAINRWMFPAAIAPHLAAAEEGVILSCAAVMDFCQQYPAAKDLRHLFIEGAGGLMVPLNATQTWVDFLVLSQIPVILVVGMKLGCINHALLTTHALTTHGIACMGWIANTIDPHMLVQKDNLAVLRHKIPYAFMGSVPFNGEFEPC